MKTLEMQNESSTQQIVWFCFRWNRCITVITCIQSKDYFYYSSLWLFLLFTRRFVQVRRRFPMRSGHSSRPVDDIRFQESWIMLFQSLQNERVRFTEQSNLLTAHVKRWKKNEIYICGGWKWKKYQQRLRYFCLYVCVVSKTSNGQSRKWALRRSPFCYVKLSPSLHSEVNRAPLQ